MGQKQSVIPTIAEDNKWLSVNVETIFEQSFLDSHSFTQDPHSSRVEETANLVKNQAKNGTSDLVCLFFFKSCHKLCKSFPFLEIQWFFEA